MAGNTLTIAWRAAAFRVPAGMPDALRLSRLPVLTFAGLTNPEGVVFETNVVVFDLKKIKPVGKRYNEVAR